MPSGSRGEDTTIPLLGKVRIELIGEIVRKDVDAAVYRAMATRGLEPNVFTSDLFESERATRTLAVAVRDPDDRTRPFGTVEEWEALDADIVNAAWHVYGDVRERLDPMSVPLTADEHLAIEVAVKKKDQPLLKSYGVAKLAAWLASMDGLPSTLPSPSLSSSESLPD